MLLFDAWLADLIITAIQNMLQPKNGAVGAIGHCCLRTEMCLYNNSLFPHSLGNNIHNWHGDFNCQQLYLSVGKFSFLPTWFCSLYLWCFNLIICTFFFQFSYSHVRKSLRMRLVASYCQSFWNNLLGYISMWGQSQVEIKHSIAYFDCNTMFEVL